MSSTAWRGAGPRASGRPELVLMAEMATVSLAGILRWICETRQCGRLAFRHGGHEKSVFFQDGNVAFAISNQRVDRIGETLLRTGAIELSQLRAAERGFRGRGRFGSCFVEQGDLTPGELWQGVEDQVAEIVRSLFAYPTGTVHFWAGSAPPDNLVRLSLSTPRLVAEGRQRRGELRKLIGGLEAGGFRLRTLESGRQHLAGEERSLYDALAREPVFPEACRALGVDRLAAARTLQLLRVSGAVALVRGVEDSLPS